MDVGRVCRDSKWVIMLSGVPLGIISSVLRVIPYRLGVLKRLTGPWATTTCIIVCQHNTKYIPNARDSG